MIVLVHDAAAAKAPVVAAVAAVGAAVGVDEMRYTRAQTLQLCFEGQARSMARRFAVPGTTTSL